MRFPARLACAFLVVGLASPASASLIPDPTIGVRGIGGGSEPITNGNWLTMTAAQCSEPGDTAGADLFAAGYVCQNYMISPVPDGFNGFTSMQFETMNAQGIFPATYQTPTSATAYSLAISPVPSAFSFFNTGVQPTTIVQLGNADNTYLCTPVGDIEPINVCYTHFQFFFLPDLNDAGPFSVRLRRVTYEVCVGLECSSETVIPTPEPAAAVLFALGTAFAARRLRRR